MNIIEPRYSFHEGDGNAKLFIQRSQEIPQDFLDHLSEARKASTQGKMGELHRFASIPVVVYENWLRQGFDPRREHPAKVIAKLKAEGLDYFITTDRKL